MGRGIIFHFLGYKLYISARTHSISGLKSLAIDIFDFKMMVKSLDFLKFSKPLLTKSLYRSCTHRERRTEAKTDSYSNDRIFQKLKYVY